MNLDQARFNMVEQQIRPWDVLDPKVLDLLMDTPRHEFVSEAQQALAYMDIELPIGENQTMLAPKVEGRILQALDVAPTETVLEIGTGSGYLTALLAKLSLSVVSVEYFERLHTLAQTNLQKYTNITLLEGDAAADWNDERHYDVIVLGGATSVVPSAYLHKLNLGGRLIATHGKSPAMTTDLITRISENEWETESLFETDMAYLVHAEPRANFTL